MSWRVVNRCRAKMQTSRNPRKRIQESRQCSKSNPIFRDFSRLNSRQWITVILYNNNFWVDYQNNCTIIIIIITTIIIIILLLMLATSFDEGSQGQKLTASRLHWSPVGWVRSRSRRPRTRRVPRAGSSWTSFPARHPLGRAFLEMPARRDFFYKQSQNEKISNTRPKIMTTPLIVMLPICHLHQWP